MSLYNKTSGALVGLFLLCMSQSIPAFWTENARPGRISSIISEIKREIHDARLIALRVLAGLPRLPVNGEIRSRFGYRRSPRRGFHEGIDIAARTGTPVHAVEAGRVVFVGWCGGYGRMVTIDHGDYVSRYGHCSKIIAEVGQIIEEGDIIAKVGRTGFATGPHLHWEIIVHGKPTDPIQFVLRKSSVFDLFRAPIVCMHRARTTSVLSDN